MRVGAAFARRAQGGIIERSHDDLAYLKSNLVELLTDRTKLVRFRDRMIAFEEKRQKDSSAAAKHQKAQEELGRWLGSYFDDAGYEAWNMYPELFKAMVMNAFPPIDKLDSKSGSALSSLDDFELKNMNFMSVMDQHLAYSLAKDPKNSVALKVALSA